MSNIRPYFDNLEEKLLDSLSEATKSLDYLNKVFPSNTNVEQSKQHTKRLIETLAKSISHLGKLRAQV